MVTICHHIHSMHTCKSEMWYVCMCDFVSLFGYLSMHISSFPSIYLLSFFICIPLVNLCILVFGWFLYSLNTTFHHTSIVYISLGFERSSSWAINLQAVWVRRFVPLDLQKSLRTVVFDYQKWPHVEGSCVFCLFFCGSVYDVQHISYSIWYIYVWIYIYIQYIYIYSIYIYPAFRYEYVPTFPYRGSWKWYEEWVFQTLRNGHW